MNEYIVLATIHKMKWTIIIVSLLLLSLSCKKRGDPAINYITLTEEETKCIIKNVTPVNRTTDIIIDGKYYDPADPNFEKCIKH